MTAAPGLVATVDVVHETSVERVGPRSDGADLRVGLGEPLRVALLAGRPGSEIAAARAIALAACVDPVLTLRGGGRDSILDRAAALRDARPDAVLIVASSQEGGSSVDLAEALRLGCAADEPPPTVLVAADERARAHVSAALDGMKFETMAEIGSAQAREAIVARFRGMRRSQGELVLRDEAIEAAARTLAAATGRSTLVVDVSGETASLAFANAGAPTIGLHAHVGIGMNADRLVSRSGLDRVRRWMPRAIDTPALLDRVFNRARWPDAVAATPLTLALELALAREAIAYVLNEAERAGIATDRLRAAQHIVCTGALARFPRPQQTVLTALDALAPEGMHVILRERPDALIAAGAIASRSVAEVLPAVEPLAMIAAMSPRRSASVTVVDDSGTIEEQVARGAFFLIATRGAVELRIAPTAERPSASELTLGVVIDARGRPLLLPPRDSDRLPTIARWYTALDLLPPDEELAGR